MEQGTLFSPVGPTRTETATVQERLISRRGDPETSRSAARRVVRSEKVNTSWGIFKHILEQHGPLTCNEASRHLADHSYWAVEFNKRVKMWDTERLIECSGERDGSRLWALVESAAK